MTAASIARAAQILRGTTVAVLTGAGVSTASGIPDYRGENSVPRTPMTFQQFVSQEDYRRHYWARTFIGYEFMHGRAPNSVHEALAGLEIVSPSTMSGVITQNIDTLHQRAGSGWKRPVIDLHGRYDRVNCMEHGHTFSREFVQGMLTQANPGFSEMVGDVEVAPDADAVLQETTGFILVDCPICGSALRPDVVFFGETVPAARMSKANALVDRADTLLVLGSSLTVHSGLRFVTRASKDDKPIVIINQGRTKGDGKATLKLEGQLTELVPELCEQLVFDR